MKIIGNKVEIKKLQPSQDVYSEITNMPKNIYPKFETNTLDTDLKRRIDEIR